MRNGRVTPEFFFICFVFLLFGAGLYSCSDIGGNLGPELPEFVYPLAPGEMRQYRYNYIDDYIAFGLRSTEKWGLMSWEVVSSNRIDEEVIAHVAFVRRDSVRERRYVPGPFLFSETTYVNVLVDSFLIRILTDRIEAGWASTLELERPEVIALGNIPRFLNNPADTVKIEQGSYSAWYVSGVGLVRYQGYCCGGHQKFDEMLLLQPPIQE